MWLEAMAEQLAFLEAAAEYVSPSFDGTKSATRNVRKNEDAVVRLRVFKERMDALYVKLDEVNEVIYSVSDSTMQSILVKRYLGNKTWGEIIGEVFIGRSRLFELHNAALAEIEALISERTKSD